MRGLGELAAPAIAKEVAALRLLAAQSGPPTNVIRFFDTGTLRVGESALLLPWVALEYVDGGAEGVTLRARVEKSIAATGSAFDFARAERAIRHLCSALDAIHRVGVVHRDVTPNNVLATGIGVSECFKVADFGVARISSVSTFGDVLLGTPGYCAPEQSFPDEVGAGPYTDVFGLACTTFFLLTGEPYFESRSIPETLVAVCQSTRRELRSSKMLHRSMSVDGTFCGKIDDLLSRATRARPEQRMAKIAEFERAALGLFAR